MLQMMCSRCGQSTGELLASSSGVEMGLRANITRGYENHATAYGRHVVKMC